MSLTATQRRLLQDLLVVQLPARRDSQAAIWLHENHHFGRLIGRQVEFVDTDRERARRMLDGLGLPHARMDKDASRADVAMYPGMSEKSESIAPASDAVALKAVGACVLDGIAVRAPPGGFVTWRTEHAIRVPADRLMVVENLETFRELERYSWIDYQGLRVLVIFRGDGVRSVADSNLVLAARSEPVWAFVDFDPAGLGVAAALPRLERLILPPAAWLRPRAAGARGVQLFEASAPQYAAILSLLKDQVVKPAWDLLLERRAGVPQEAMRDAC